MSRAALRRSNAGPEMPTKRVRTTYRETILFWMLAAFLALVALTGGGSRPDIVTLAFVWPLAVMLCAFASWTVSLENLRRCRFAFILLACMFALTLIHLVPLPPAIWHALPGRGLISDIDARAGLGEVWRPISLAPIDTRGALCSLFVPLAVLLTGVQLGPQSLRRLLPVIIVVALLSGLLGLFQIVGSPTGSLFFYRHTNYGVATGLFANRNHQAIFLATTFPMLAAFVTTRAGKALFARDALGAFAAGLFLIPLVLITGSRAGTMISGLAWVSVAFLLRIDFRGVRSGSILLQRIFSARALVIMAIVAIAALVALTIGVSRAVSVTRIFESGTQGELRFKVWPVIMADIPTYLPIGSGIGSFVQVFKIIEPDEILRPTYLNHAHNEVLEILLTAGIPGAGLLVAAIIGWVIAARRAFARSMSGRSENLFARLGLIIIALFALGSLADYPLRTPFLTAILAVATLWTSRTVQLSSKDDAIRP